LPEVIRLAVMMYIRYPLSLRQVEDLLLERGIDICHETVRFWWNRFGPLFAAEIRKRRVHSSSYSQWRWYFDEVFVKINGEMRDLWRAMAKFWGIETLQKFASVHASIHDHFNQDRHRDRRDIFMQNRSAALAEWRQLAPDDLALARFGDWFALDCH
jgi:transposase-like protein